MTISTDAVADYDQGWRFDNTYRRLPDTLFTSATPAVVRSPQLTILNCRLAEDLGLDLKSLPPETTAALLSGQSLPVGSQPIAQAYAGHQFGGFTMLGDGRAILLGEHRTPDGRLVDVQLKGAGRTLFSRGGDGRAALGPMLREYILSEAMAALGIPTTRSLAVVATGEPVYRMIAKRGAILTRIASSHIRVGTFEYAARRDEPTLRALADYAIDRHDPELADSPKKYLEFFERASDRQAALVAQWQAVGFIHGVMNTDNVAVSGETIDYGPCAFMNAYNPDTVYSSIDHAGRYSYGNQPRIMQWNLARCAETLLPLIDPQPERAIDLATSILKDFPARFERHWLSGMRRKLGLQTDDAGDRELVQSLLDWMHKTTADFTNTFRNLTPESPDSGPSDRDPEFSAWHSRWQSRLRQEGQSTASALALMQSVNPAVIPRNHQVEAALTAAEDRDDLSVLHRLLDVLASPYESRPDLTDYQNPPIDEHGYRTYCGT